MYIAGGYSFIPDGAGWDVHNLKTDIWRREIKSQGLLGPWERLNATLPESLDGATAHRIDHILYIVCGQSKVPRVGFVGRNSIWMLDLRTWDWKRLTATQLQNDSDDDDVDKYSFNTRVWHSSTVLPAPLPPSWKKLISPLDQSDDSVLDQAAIIITAGRSANLKYYNDSWVFLTRTRVLFQLPGSATGPSPRAAHASTIVDVEPLGRCMPLFGGRYRLAAQWEDSDDEDDFDYEDNQSDDELLDRVDRPGAVQRKESHEHYNGVWMYPFDTAAEPSWTELNVISAERPRRRSCLSVFSTPQLSDTATVFGGYTCSNMRYRYFSDAWVLKIQPNGEDCAWKRVEYRLSDATSSGGCPRISHAPPPLSIHAVPPAHKDGWLYLFGGEGLLKSGKDNTHYLSATWAFKLPSMSLRSDCAPFRRHLHKFISSSTDISALILPTLPEVSISLPTTVLFARAQLTSSRTVGLKSAVTEIAPFITQWLCYGHLGPSYDIESVDEVLAPELLTDLTDLSYSFANGASLRLRLLESMHPLILGFSNTESAGALKSLGLYLSTDFSNTMKKLEAIATIHNDTTFLELLRSGDVDAAIKQGRQHTCDDDLQEIYAKSWTPRRTGLKNPFTLQVSVQRNLLQEHTWVVDADWLSSRCPFFESLLRSGLSESTAMRYEVQIDTPLSATESYWVIETLLQYLHSNRVPLDGSISPAAVDALADVAHYWGLITDNELSHDIEEEDHFDLARFLGENQS
eukprot:TRINITY_DN8852_c0_g1_i2.p1 TRINITY_DN8852_c0_g1~~TRINITY_DN8852_c0_g1_i2.p1  ORF type:complete len:835 (+),score=111.06 TRINITY_DN8852_c0_g1_i2:274-2505(+)